jgi:hypothetical protein
MRTSVVALVCQTPAATAQPLAIRCLSDLSNKLCVSCPYFTCLAPLIPPFRLFLSDSGVVAACSQCSITSDDDPETSDRALMAGVREEGTSIAPGCRRKS